MNWIPIIVVVAVFTGFFLLKRMSLVSPDTAKHLLAQGALVIDVRSPDEFRSGPIPGAFNLPLDTLAQELPRRVPDKNQPLLLHCLSGTRSAMARRQLCGMGYAHVFNLGSYGRARRIVSGTHTG